MSKNATMNTLRHREWNIVISVIQLALVRTRCLSNLGVPGLGLFAF